jgi:uncharacterized RDD family membrane protein YckC
MPIKVRCGDCNTVLNLPDKAAGKVAKCRECGGRVRVPAKKTRPGAAARKRSESPDDLLHGLDLRGIEDTKRRVCPGCATPVHQDDVECPRCGVTIATGTLSQRQRIKHERKGPPPEEFYGAVWSNSWKFLKKHWGYGVTTAVVWSITLAMSLTCLFAWNWYIEGRTAELVEQSRQSGIIVEGRWLFIDPGDGVIKYDGTSFRTKATLPAPRIDAIQDPPSYFWMGMAIVFQLGFGGWAWTLATKIVELTMAGEKKIKRFNVDFFGNLTMGFRFYFWPVIVMAPVAWIGPALIAAGQPIPGGIVAAATFVIPILFLLPAAVVHMSQNYQYRAWLLTWMTRDFFATIAPTLYLAAMLFFLVLLIPTGAAAAVGATWSQLMPWLETQKESIISQTIGWGPGTLRFMIIELPLVFSGAFLALFLTLLVASFTSVFMMRAIGLFGVYFRPDLSIVNEFPDLEPAGFGPRYLAFLIDLIIIGLFFGASAFAASLLRPVFFMYGIPDNYKFIAAQVITTIGGLVLTGLYFSRGESGAARATLGKWSIGLIVLQNDDKPVSRKLGFKRAAMAFLGAIPLFGGFLMCVFRPDKKAMHDLSTKTKVVWRGEER